jgi:hypothetical protein
MKKKIIIFVFFTTFFLISSSVSAYDLKVESYNKSTVKQLRWYVDSTMTKKNYGSYATIGSLGWNSSPYIEAISSIDREASAQLRFYSSNTDKGDIVATNTNYKDVSGKTTKYSKIYTWAGFASLSSIEKNETMVHEVGHSLGLNHEDVKFSIMISEGFIGRTTPTTDDFSGIRAKYQ